MKIKRRAWIVGLLILSFFLLAIGGYSQELLKTEELSIDGVEEISFLKGPDGQIYIEDSQGESYDNIGMIRVMRRGDLTIFLGQGAHIDARLLNFGRLKIESEEGQVEIRVPAGDGPGKSLIDNRGQLEIDADLLCINNYSAGDGGALVNSNGAGCLIKGQASFRGNRADGNGGAICINSGSLEVEGDLLCQDNKIQGKDKRGGAIYNNGSLKLGGSTRLEDNHGGVSGGAIYNRNEIKLVDLTIRGNESDKNGGGLTNYASDDKNQARIEVAGDLEILDNYAGVLGGGLANNSSLSVAGGSRFEKNKSQSSGGAIYNYEGGQIEFQGLKCIANETEEGSGIINNNWKENQAEPRISVAASFLAEDNIAGNDGAVLHNNGQMDFGADFMARKNQAKNRGGVIFNCDSGQIDLAGQASFIENQGIYGGAIYNSQGQSVINFQAGSEFTGNQSCNNGGAVFNTTSMNFLGASNFTGNIADCPAGNEAEGGGIYNDGLMNFTDLSCRANTSNNDGAGVFNARNGEILISSKLVLEGNQAQTEGGGLCNRNRLKILGGLEVRDNQAQTRGGGISNICPENMDKAQIELGPDLEEVIFTGNSSMTDGGAIYNRGRIYGGPLDLGDKMVFTGNYADRGYILVGSEDYREELLYRESGSDFDPARDPDKENSQLYLNIGSGQTYDQIVKTNYNNYDIGPVTANYYLIYRDDFLGNDSFYSNGVYRLGSQLRQLVEDPAYTKTSQDSKFYEFIGWSEEAGGQLVDEVSIGRENILYANWEELEKIEYRIKYRDQDGQEIDGQEPGLGEKPRGQILTLEDLEEFILDLEGYDFREFSYQGAAFPEEGLLIEEEVEIDAIYDRKLVDYDLNISYETEEGLNLFSLKESHREGTELDLSDYKKDFAGYDFLGFRDESDQDIDGGLVMDRSRSLRALYSKKPVDYDLNISYETEEGLKLFSLKESHREGTDLDLSDYKKDFAGYDFLGFRDESDQDISGGLVMDRSRSLRALYSKKPVDYDLNISYETEGGLKLFSLKESHREGTELDLSDYKKDFAGYDFLGFRDESDQDISGGLVMDRSRSLRALYSKKPVDYDLNISYETEEGLKLFSLKESHREGTDLDLSDYKEDFAGYDFLGFKDESDQDISGNLVMDRSRSIKALYREIKKTYEYTIKYKDEEDRLLKDEIIIGLEEEGSTLDLNDYYLDIENYEFLRFEDFQGQVLEDQIVVRGDLNIRLVYRREKVDLVLDYLDTDGASLGDSLRQSLDKGSSIDLSDYKEDFAGYEFLEFRDESGQEVQGEILLDRSRELRAIYSKKELPPREVEYLIKYKDEDYNILREPVVDRLEEGSYLDLDQFIEEIEGYSFLRFEDESGQALEGGLEVREDISIRAIYRKDTIFYEIYIQYLDQAGEVLGSLSQKFESGQLVDLDGLVEGLAGYELIRLEDESGQEVQGEISLDRDLKLRAIYRKKLESFSYLIKYKDEDNKALREPVEGWLEEGSYLDLDQFIEEIEGYDFLGFRDESDQELSGKILLDANRTIRAIYRSKIQAYEIFIVDIYGQLLKDQAGRDLIIPLTGQEGDQVYIRDWMTPDQLRALRDYNYSSSLVLGSEHRIELVARNRQEIIEESKLAYEIVHEDRRGYELDREEGSGRPGEIIRDREKDFRNYRLYRVEPRKGEIKLSRQGENKLVYIYERLDSGGGSGSATRPSKSSSSLAKLNKREHMSYLKGYPDNSIRPEAYITRSEVAAVLYRLLEENYRKTIRTDQYDFTDYRPGHWANEYVASLAKAGVLKGYEDNSFRGDRTISRAEFMALVSKFEGLNSLAINQFGDTEGHWARDYISSASDKGWIKGYPDASFRPDAKLTRSEFVVVVNKLLDRRVEADGILEGIKSYKDLREDSWYYYPMLEALNSHSYSRYPNGREKWLELRDLVPGQ